MRLVLMTYPLTAPVLAWVVLHRFSTGTWIGVELDHPEGRHDGRVEGVRYFYCKANEQLSVALPYGLMVRPTQIANVLDAEDDDNEVESFNAEGTTPLRDTQDSLRSTDAVALNTPGSADPSQMKELLKVR